MPFATEEMSDILGNEGFLVHEEFPSQNASFQDTEASELLERTKRVVSAVRKFRAESKVDDELEGLIPERVETGVFTSLANVRPVEEMSGTKAVLPAGDVAVEVSLTEEQRQGEIGRLRKEIERVGAEVERAEKKLANANFVERAPQEIVSAERDKLDVNARMLDTLTRRLEEYL
jgi:valyl-tRNA synthetase